MFALHTILPCQPSLHAGSLPIYSKAELTKHVASLLPFPSLPSLLRLTSHGKATELSLPLLSSGTHMRAYNTHTCYMLVWLPHLLLFMLLCVHRVSLLHNLILSLVVPFPPTTFSSCFCLSGDSMEKVAVSVCPKEMKLHLAALCSSHQSRFQASPASPMLFSHQALIWLSHCFLLAAFDQ